MVSRRIPAGQESAQAHLRSHRRAGAGRAAAGRDDRRVAALRTGRRGSLPHLRGRCRQGARQGRVPRSRPRHAAARTAARRSRRQKLSVAAAERAQPRALSRLARARCAGCGDLLRARRRDRARARSHPRSRRERAREIPGRARRVRLGQVLVPARGAVAQARARRRQLPAAAGDPAGDGGDQRSVRSRGCARRRVRAAQRTAHAGRHQGGARRGRGRPRAPARRALRPGEEAAGRAERGRRRTDCHPVARPGGGTLQHRGCGRGDQVPGSARRRARSAGPAHPRARHHALRPLRAAAGRSAPDRAEAGPVQPAADRARRIQERHRRSGAPDLRSRRPARHRPGPDRTADRRCAGRRRHAAARLHARAALCRLRLGRPARPDRV